MADEPFLGQIQVFGFNFPPRSYAGCDGQLLSIAANNALFSLLGTTYGGDGRSTFALPDLRGRAAIHFQQGPGLSAYSLGQKGGEESHTLVETEMAAHKHNAVASANNTDQNTPVGNLLAKNGSSAAFSNTNSATMNTQSLNNTGGGQSHENMQPFLVVNYCIALSGIFPSRN